MSQTVRRKRSKKDGNTLLMTFAVLSLITIASTSFIDRSTAAMRMARHNLYEIQTASLCDSGVQSVVRSLWRPFKTTQNFLTMDPLLTGSSTEGPAYAQSGTMNGIGKFSAAVVGYYDPDGTGFSRVVRIRAVGWIDRNGNGVLDSGDVSRTIDIVYRFDLLRSKVFDYTYFVNNFGWMDGFGPNDLVVNGDMRANGDFAVTNGSGTYNGSIVASANSKLTPAAAGLISGNPQKWSTATYLTSTQNNANVWKTRMRQAYDPAIHGAVGSAQFEQWRDLVFMSDAQMTNGRQAGATFEDATGVSSWTNPSGTLSKTLLDSTPSTEVIMPDLSNFGNLTDPADPKGGRFARTKSYADTKPTFLDGSANPNYSGSVGAQNEYNGDGSPNPNFKGAYADVWDQSKNMGNGAYKRISVSGVVCGSAMLVGTQSHPIRLHGPVTINGDAGIAGYVSGQGTIYASRNIHVVASVKYSNPPNFTGTNITNIEASNEHCDILGLAASQSVIMGDPGAINSYDLGFMSPPFTKPRLDEEGNSIPAFDASQTDSYGIKQYQSLLQFDPSTNKALQDAASAGLDQIDAVMYTNFVGGGNVGTSGHGFTINGSIISRDEAMISWSLPMWMNYDNRIKERTLTSKPLIDIELPRSPLLTQSGYQDLGFGTYVSEH